MKTERREQDVRKDDHLPVVRPGEPREAAEFYAATFPDSHVGKIIPSPIDTPSGPEGQELIVEFTVCGRKFLGLNGGPKFVPNRCEERNRLLREYEAATLAFSVAVKELRRRMGTSPKEEYKRLAQTSNDARVKSEGARIALEQHMAAHDC